MIARLLISPSLDIRIEAINKILSSHLMGSPRLRNHPDVLYFPADSKLGIEQARSIKQHFFLKPYFAKGKVVALEDASTLTFEAQNSLLKILEEPPSNAILILGASSEAKFLPTVLSRCQIVNLSPSVILNPSVIPSATTVIPSASEESQDLKSIEQLLNSSIADRFEYIEKLKDREAFLSTLIQYFRQLLLTAVTSRSNPHFPALQKFLKELLQAEEWAAQNVNIRAILEYLMLVMPKK